ncbi:MAG: hypothetical protein PW735_11970 [Acidobacteriaceae bacterium]|nr:hypothetical protein [Acidobacteriaceae bacterium]
MADLTPEQAQAVIDKKRESPLSDLSAASISDVAEATAIIARQKAETAQKAAQAAQEAKARLEAIRRAHEAPVEPAPLEAPAEPEATSPEAETAPSQTETLESPEAAPALPAAVEASAEPIAGEPAPPAAISETSPEESDEISAHVMPRVSDREDMPSGVVRMADALRVASAARTAGFRSTRSPFARRRPAAVLDPVANQAGLFSHAETKKQPIFTPRLILLFVFMVLFGLYATGNLPQFDRWTDSVVNSAHQHNDQIVHGILHPWHMLSLILSVVLFLVAVVFLVKNIRARRSAS